MNQEQIDAWLRDNLHKGGVVMWPEDRTVLAAVLAPLFAAAKAEAFDQGQKSGMRHAVRMSAAANIGRLDLAGPMSPNPYRTT